MRSNELDLIFRKLRDLERGPAPADPNVKIFDSIFEKLRLLEKRADKLEAWRNFTLGAVAAIGVLLEIAQLLLK